MEMHQIRYFLAVCRTLNFTKAAEECNVAQPSLTRAVQKLEEEFGGQLFNRERANTHLTELGRAMQPHLERTFEAAQSAKQLAVGFKKGDIAHLRLGVTNSVSSQLITDMLIAVNDSVPNFELTLGGGPQTDVIGKTLEGEHDLIILGHDEQLPERMRNWSLFRETLDLIMPKTHRLASKENITIGDLEGETIVERLQCPACEQLKRLCADSKVTIQFTHSASSDDQIQSIVKAGLGIALQPRSIALQPGIVAKTISDTDFARIVSLGAVAGRRFSPASDVFVKLARTRDWNSAVKR
jgi:DNA-binding transcriptional LysR family regulator